MAKGDEYGYVHMYYYISVISKLYRSVLSFTQYIEGYFFDSDFYVCLQEITYPVLIIISEDNYKEKSLLGT